MHKQAKTNLSVLFYVLWFLSLSLQAYFTELSADEAYYWMYSQHLAWGYFDHPPVIALLIKLGYALLPNELGVRLFPILLNTISLFFVEKLIAPKNLKLFFILVISVALLHFIGFFAIPDAPFIFFAVLFLSQYKKFLEKSNTKNSILLAVFAAFMCLSKYHGFFIIALCLISNFKLLLQKNFWFVVAIASIIFLPHLLWQIQHLFPSFQYHFFERSEENYIWNFTVEYLAGQLFVLGPLTGLLFFISVWKIPFKNQFEKSLKYLFWGAYLFFFFMSFKGRVEAHWTYFTFIPALYFSVQFIEKNTKAKKLIPYVFSISIILILAGKIFILHAVEISKDSKLFNPYKLFHNKNEMLTIGKYAQSYPVAFINSYQKASLFSFYTKSKAFSLNNTFGRKNQFDIWNSEDQFLGQKVMIIPNFDMASFQHIPNLNENVCFTFEEQFQSYSKIMISAKDIKANYKSNEVIALSLYVWNVYKPPFRFENNGKANYLMYQFFNGKNLVEEKILFEITNQHFNKEIPISLKMPSLKGDYGMYFSIKSSWLPPSINSVRYKIVIKK